MRRSLTRLLIIAAVACCASLAYFAFSKHRISSLEAACGAARQAKQWAELERLATRWITLEQDKAQPWLYAAEAASEQGQELRSAGYLYYLPNDDPRTPDALLALSHMQFGGLNQPVAAARTCERIIHIQPDAGEAHRRLIFFYAMSRQRLRLIKEARRAIQVGCDTPETYLYLVGADWMTFTNGDDLNQLWLQSEPDSETFTVAAAFHRVRSSALDEDVEEQTAEGTSKSEQLMSDLLVRFPKNLELLAFHLDLATFRGDEDRVTELLAQAPPESVEDSRFWRYKGWVHDARRESEEAEAAYLKCVELNPFDGQTQHNLAAIYRRMSESAKVEKYQSLAVLGKEVRRDCLQSPNTQSLATDLLTKIQLYAAQAGDSQTAARLQERLADR